MKKSKSGYVATAKADFAAIKKAKNIPHDHREQRALREKRREASNPTYSLITELKAKWEQARMKETDKAKRTAIINDLARLLKGRVNEVRVLKHALITRVTYGIDRLFSSTTARVLSSARSTMAPRHSEP